MAVVLAMVAIELVLLGERLVYIRRRRIDAGALASRVMQDLRTGDLDRLARDLAAEPAVETAALAEALRWYGAGPVVFDEVLTRAFAARRRELAIGIAALGLLAVTAPLVAIAVAIATPEPASGVALAAALVASIPAILALRAVRIRQQTAEANVGVLGNALIAHMKLGHVRAPVAAAAES